MFSSLDHSMMLHALQLAKRGRFTTAPNPNVGCVIAQGDHIVGQGYHYQAGQPHAEVFALREAGERAKGATAYVTLEPCSHYGRTPPCAEALVKANVTRVVCAMVDPNPKVAGRGIAMLEAAGIEVQTGLLEADAKALNRGFIKRMKTGLPFVQLKLAASLDGRTALANGESKWITSPQARADVQAYRAQSGAILSTSATVLADDPSLNVRWSELSADIQADYPQTDSPQDNLRQPTRIIIDSQNRVSPTCRLAQLPGQTLLARRQCDQLAWPESVQQITVPSSDTTNTETAQVDLKELMQQLARDHDINHIWVEAGAGLAGALINAKLVDELILYQAPKLMGSDSRGLVDLLGLTSMSHVPTLTISDVRTVGPDIRITASVSGQV
ncbi:bifunctional diaminohydroxyphosphoribosylaminopyrimidine deaminase/5-amino-6-(5-phosphoribosylamino)uracil reductase RibD [Photobacterium sanguinicancri]|uniref:Riboflavin biosynthesis protein RibD n=1 Tax=Photobacterium sanguinicancri TaxID=875932 RepID=A0AAW7YBP0_9GAMM|nr:bifunctional diaminohydroxyphosphoribosylaminopyrimidine deaminase/5-amino-6-(5-phosphoribosylamino)uracil reductase RibD [Photobacterium sanguinicancri]KXI22089.1 5-amino-6-(5-phosphoribosylamino)uracil reductase [Photobacterium sanguinicancri]MDO6544934.1 bifunctional diaminohydroxyphosphoribosylaminopyrimidine deaminase/5-amino-6-(5-phosphoribosylamino)uracil reductase RibD [Photobacterium sanguinicancri]